MSDAGTSIGVEPFDGDDATRLIRALDDEVAVRYAEDIADEEHADHAMLVMHPEAVVAPKGAFLIARLDGEAIGCVALRPAPTGEDGTGELKRMYVAPAARGRGISRLLLTTLEDHARDLGYRRLILETGTRQPEAMALYESAGWAPITPYGGYRHSPVSRCYAKTLAPPS